MKADLGTSNTRGFRVYRKIAREQTEMQMMDPALLGQQERTYFCANGAKVVKDWGTN